MRFRNRKQAGQELAERVLLGHYGRQGAIVYALPRGGVVIGRMVADALLAPLDMIIVRKITPPNDPEYALAAISEDGDLLCDDPDLVQHPWFRHAANRALHEAQRRRLRYGPALPRIANPDTTDAIVVDDGMATGLTMRAALQTLRRRHHPKRIVVALPVAPSDAQQILSGLCREVIVLHSPTGSFGAVGQYYAAFPPVPDRQVIALLQPRMVAEKKPGTTPRKA